MTGDASARLDRDTVLAVHEVRISHCEEALAAVAAQGQTLAGHTVKLDHLAERTQAQEAKLTGLRNWMIGVLATSAGTLAVLLLQMGLGK